MAQLSTSTTTVVHPVTSGPPINDLQFQGYYYDSSSSWEAIRCPTSQSLISTANYAQCCSYGATTCTTMWTSCRGSTAIGVSSAVCTYCGTMSIYDQYPPADQAPFTEIVCGNYWLASTVYRNIVASSTTISIATLTSTPTSTPTPTSVSSTAPTSTASGTTPTAVNSPSSTYSSSPTPTAAPPPASKAWIAGVVIGPVVALALIALAVWLFCFRNRAHTSGNANTATTTPQYPYHSGTSGPQSPGTGKQPTDYYQPQPQKFHQPQEMSSVHHTHELPAGQ